MALGDWCDMCADVGVGVGRFGDGKGASRMVAQVHGLLQLPLPRHLLGFRVGLSVKRPAPRVGSLRRAVPRALHVRQPQSRPDTAALLCS